MRIGRPMSMRVRGDFALRLAPGHPNVRERVAPRVEESSATGNAGKEAGEFAWGFQPSAISTRLQFQQFDSDKIACRNHPGSNRCACAHKIDALARAVIDLALLTKHYIT